MTAADDEEARRLAAHLAAEDQVDVELELVALQCRAIQVRHAPHFLADDACGVVDHARIGDDWEKSGGETSIVDALLSQLSS